VSCKNELHNKRLEADAPYVAALSRSVELNRFAVVLPIVL
jgi:hypothetical protein